MIRRSPAVNIDSNRNSNPMRISVFLSDLLMMDDDCEKIIKLDNFICSLEDELKRIFDSKQQLPYCVLFLKEAITRFKDVKRACEAHAISNIIKYTKSKEFLVDDNERKKDREIINIGSDNEEKTHISGPSILSVPPGFEPIEKRVRNSGGTSSVMIGQEPPAKRRRTWSADLHRRFQHAVSTLGGPAVAKPKDIKDRMQVADITEAEIKNHLRKYRPRGVSPLTRFQDPRLMVGQNVPKMSGNMIHFGSQQPPLRIGESSSNGQMAAAGYNYRTSDGWLIYSAPTENMLSMSGIPFQSGSQQMPFYTGESSNSLMTAAPHNAGGRKLISKPRIHGNGPMNNKSPKPSFWSFREPISGKEACDFSSWML